MISNNLLTAAGRRSIARRIVPALLATLAVALCSQARAQSASDLWNVSHGNVITAHSGQGTGDLRNMFGGTYSSPEAGTAFFADAKPHGFVHYVEFERATAFSLTGYRLRLADDSANGNRGVVTFRLYAFDAASNSYQLIDTYTPPTHPYGNAPAGTFNLLAVTRNVTAITAKKFRAEFVQHNTTNSGPRVLELDAISPFQNLLENGSAEDDPAVTGNGTADHDLAGWVTETGQFTATRYTAGGGYPVASSPGPSGRGGFFFSGGQAPSSSGSQIIDVSAYAARIDAGSQAYSLSGFLGGFEGQTDDAQLSVTFKDAGGAALDSASIGPVTPAERNNVTGLLSRVATGTVPVGTRSVEAVLLLTKSDPAFTYNDGYADNLDFRMLPDEFNARDEFALNQGGTTGVWRYGYSASDTDHTFTQYVRNDIVGACSDTFERWFDPNTGDFTPQIARNTGAARCNNIPSEMMFVHPGPTGKRSVLRWTAPAAGTYQVTGAFQRQNPSATTDLKVLANATEPALFADVLTGATANKGFDFEVTAAAGDTLDFSVGWGTGGYNADGSLIAVTIRKPPLTECATPAADLRVWLPGENSTVDVQSGNTNGSLVGNATYDDGRVGRGFKFDGAGDYLMVPDNAAQRPANQLTVEGWIRYNSLNNLPHFISKPLRDSNLDSYVVWYDGSLNVGYQPVGGNMIAYGTGFQPPLGVWLHYALVINTDDTGPTANTIKLFINGVEFFSGPASDPIYYNGVNDGLVPHPFVVGTAFETNNPVFFLNGQVDEVSIYGRALSQPEVFEIVQQGAYGKCASDASCVPAPQGLVSLYKGEQNALDSGSDNHGTLQNGATFAVGKVGQAFSLDGVDDRILVADPVPASLQLQNEISLNAWIYVTSYPSDTPNGLGMIVGSQFDGTFSGASIFLDGRNNPDGHVAPPGHIHFQIGNGSWHHTNTRTAVPLNQWVHISANRKAGEDARIYFNGVLQPSTSVGWSGGITYNNAWFAIGQQKDMPRPFKGLIDEVSVFSRALAESEVQSIVNADSAGVCPTAGLNPGANQISWFTGDGDTNNFVADSAGTLKANATYGVGKVAQAFHFDGDGDYVEVPDAAEHKSANQLTIEGWFNLNDVGNGLPHLVSKPLRNFNLNSYALYLEGGRIWLGYFDVAQSWVSIDTGYRPTVGAWTHYAMVINTDDSGSTANTMKLFVNGVEFASRSANNPVFYDGINNGLVPHPLLIGAELESNNLQWFMNGRSDEVGIYSRALSSSELLQIYNAGSAGKAKQQLTGTGTAVQTQLSDATVTFGAVSAGGTTTQRGLDVGLYPALPSNAAFTGLAYDISTTATYQSGSADSVGICFNVPALANWTFSKLRILHLENGVWMDRTLRRGTAPTLCTSGLTSLSPFVIVQVEPPFDEIPDATTAEDLAISIPFTLANPTGVTSVTASSANTELVPNNAANLIITGTGANRTLLITPAANEHGTASITVTVQRGASSASDGFVLTVTDVNDAPVVTLDSLGTVVEDSAAITISKATLLTNDLRGPANENTQSISFGSVSNAIGGSVTDDGGANVVFTPAADFYGVAGFSYTIHDNGTTNGGGDGKTSAPGDVRFTITEVNEAPTAVADSLSAIAEDSGVRTIPFGHLTGNDPRGPANESGQSLAVVSVGNAVGGSVSIVGNDVLFAPAADFNGPASFTYRVEDNGTTNGSPAPLTSGQAMVSFTVTEVNDAPTAVNDSLTDVAEDAGARTITLAELIANDSRGPANESSQTIEIAIIAAPTNGTITMNGLDVVFTPHEHYHGPVSFTYVIQDNGTTNGGANPLMSAAATVSFTVYEVNDVPVANNDTLATIAEDAAPLTIPFGDLLGNDSNGPESESSQTLTVSSVSAVAGGTVTITGTNVIFTPTPDFNGAASFTYIAADNGTTNGATDVKTSEPAIVSFTMTEVNDAPIAAADPLTAVAEDSGARTIALSDLLANDTAGPENEAVETIVVTAIGNAVGGTAVISGTDVIFTPAADFNGPASFTYTIGDNGTTAGEADPLTSTAGLVSFTITEVNDTPTANSDTLAAIAEDSGARTIPFSALIGNDSRGPENESGQTLTVNSVSNAVGGTATVGDGAIFFLPDPDFYGPARFSYTVQDNGTTNSTPAPLTSAAATVSFNVTEVNDGPTAVNDTLSAIAEDSAPRTIAFADLLGNDSRGPANEGDQTLTVASVSNAVGGAVAISGSSVIFTPTAHFNGPASFVYTAQDNGTTGGASGAQTSGPATVSFTITEVNDVPVATSDSLTPVAEGSDPRAIAFADLTGNDSTGPENESDQTLVVSSVSNPVGGTVTINGGNVVFTPAPDFYGAASFAYTAQDNGTTNSAAAPQTSAAATVSFTVTAINDAPTAANDALTAMLEDAGARSIPFTDLTANDSTGPANESEQTLTVSSVSDAVGGTATIGNGAVFFLPDPNFNGTASFSYIAQDNGTTNGGNDFRTSAPATVSFTITAVDDAPTFSLGASPSAINEDAAAQSIDNFATNFRPGPASATDEASQTLVGYNVTVTEKTGSLVFSSAPTINNAGQLAYTIAPNTSGTATISVTATDSGSGTAPNVNTSAPQTFTVTVNPVNDAPSFTRGANQQVNGEHGAQSVPAFATAISAGPADEAGQTVAFTTTNDNNALFTVQPTVSPNGTLTYTPSDTKAGIATVSVVLKDDGGTTFGGEDTSAAQTFTISVVDATAPVFTGVPEDMTIEATSSSGAPVNYTPPTASDKVSGTVAVSCSPASGSTFVLGTTAVTCSASDESGNVATADFDVTVQDTTPPVMINVPENITIEATSANGAAVSYTKPTAEDSVSGPVTVSCVPPTGSTFALGTSTVTCSASDLAGNKVTKTFSVTVQDTIAPAISNTPANITAEATSAAGAAVTYTNPTASDAVDAEPTITCAPASGSTFALGTTTVTCTAQDDAGNSSTSTFDVTVQDKTAPAITAPDEVVAEATAADGATVSFTASATDAVTPDVAVTCTPASGTKFALGSTTVTCSATDAAGNTATDSFAVIVRDTQGPAFTGVPADISVEATNASGATVTYTAPTASDAVSGAATVTCAPASGSTFAVGTTAVTCSAKDAADNQSTATFNVLVRDTTAPVFANVPANVTAEATGPDGAAVTYSDPTATDTVDPSVTVTCTPASGSTFALGSTTVTCTAVDKAANQATATFSVTVRDTKAPTFSSAPPNVTAEATGPDGAPVSYTKPSAEDVVGATVTCTPASGSTFALGNSTVTCTAQDAAGNQATTTFTVSVVDTTAPVITAPADMVVYNDVGQNGAFVTFTVTATDAVDQSIKPTLSHASGSLFPIGTTEVTATATDGKGNQAAPKKFKITVRETEMANISTRAAVGTGENVLIGGFIITGTEPLKVVVRAVGPSMAANGVAGALQDPTLELFRPDGTTVFNDNWGDSQSAELTTSGLAPTDPRESAVIASLEPGAYTAVIRGAGDTTGLALVEAYALSGSSTSNLANISTRGTVQTGESVLIGGLIVLGKEPTTVVVRAIGPSLAAAGVTGALEDPALELRDSNGEVMVSNNDWRDAQQAQIEATGLAPTDARESAILRTLPAGNYTAIISGRSGTTGVALIEIYNLR